MKTAIKILCSDVACADYTCRDLLLEPETEQESEQNARILEELREQLDSISAYITAILSTPVDVAPLPDPPSEIYLPPTAAEFIALVRAGKVQVETPSGDTTNALIDRASVGWARIGWDYELGDNNEWVAYHDSTVIDELTVFQRVDHKVSANGVTFIIEP